MAKDQNRRLSPTDLKEDIDSLTTLEELKEYAPSNAEYVLAKVTAAKAAMNATQTAEKKAADVLKTARDKAIASEWAYHNAILGVKQQVVAQFGDNSAEIQLFGLKKKSEYKSPARKPKK